MRILRLECFKRITQRYKNNIKKTAVIIVVLLVLIAAGISVYFITRASSSAQAGEEAGGTQYHSDDTQHHSNETAPPATTSPAATPAPLTVIEETPIPAIPDTPQPIIISSDSNQLYETIYNTSSWVLLTIEWNDEENTELNKTIYERDLNGAVWTMKSRNGEMRIIEPVFILYDDEVHLNYTTTIDVASSLLFYDGGTGTRNGRDFTWHFETHPSISLGSIQEAYSTENFYDAESQYGIFAIYIFSDSGDELTLTRDEIGKWRMSGWRIALADIEPDISYNTGVTTVSFANSSKYYSFSLYSDGVGFDNADNNEITWSYSYYAEHAE